MVYRDIEIPQNIILTIPLILKLSAIKYDTQGTIMIIVDSIRLVVSGSELLILCFKI